MLNDSFHTLLEITNEYHSNHFEITIMKMQINIWVMRSQISKEYNSTSNCLTHPNKCNEKFRL